MGSVCVLVMVSTLLMQVEIACGEDADHCEYSVLYGGNYSAADAHRFSYRLYYYGTDGTWSGVTQTSWDAPQRDVAHWDVTNGYAGVDPSPGANQRDILYLSTHGWPNQMRFYKPASQGDLTPRRDQYGRPDNIGPAAGGLWGSETYGYLPNYWEIGADYTQGNTVTSSRWNDDIEWVYLASCNALSSDSGSRAAYARTLLGSPQRAHAIMGYGGPAPGDSDDVGIVDWMFDRLEEQRSIRYAWLSANGEFKGGGNAAAVLHARHRYEGLPPVSPRENDSPAASPVEIEYWYLLLGVIWQGPSPLSMTTSESSGVSLGGLESHGLYGPKGAPSTHASLLIKGRDTTYQLAYPLPKSPGSVRLLDVVEDEADPHELARTLLGARAVRFEARGRGSAFKADKRFLRVFPGRNFRIQEDSEYGDPVGFGRERATAVAESYAREHGGLPDDAVLERVDEVRVAKLDPASGRTAESKTCAYVVRYRHSYEGIPIAGPGGDEIAVTVGARERVCSPNRVWRRVRGSCSTTTVIGAEAALDALARDGERALGLPSLVDVVGVRLVYYAENPWAEQRMMKPAWEIVLADSRGDEDTAPVFAYVDACTGSMLIE